MGFANISAPKPRPTPPSTGYQTALNYYQGMAEPDLAYINLQKTQQQNKLGQLYAANGLAQSQYGQNAGFADQDYNLGLQKLGLQRSDIDVNDLYYQRMLGLNDMDYQGTLKYQDTLQALASQLLGLQQGAVNQNYNSNRRNQLSSVTATGGLQSRNNILTLQDLYGTQQNQLGQLQQGYDQTLAGIAEAKRSAESAYGKTKLGLEHDLQLNENQRAMLDLDAKELGLSREKALAAMKQGLAKLNLDTVMSVQDLYDAMEMGDFQTQQIASQIINQAKQAYLGGYFPDTPANSGRTGNFGTYPSKSSSAAKTASKNAAVNAYMHS